jgi:hypothetical protein
MDKLLKDVLSLAESNATWIETPAEHFEHLAVQFREEEKAQWQLLAAVYREKAQAIQSEADKVRASLENGDRSEAGLENA